MSSSLDSIIISLYDIEGGNFRVFIDEKFLCRLSLSKAPRFNVH